MPTKQHIDVSQSATMEKSQMLKTIVKWNGCLGSDCKISFTVFTSKNNMYKITHFTLLEINELKLPSNRLLLPANSHIKVMEPSRDASIVQVTDNYSESSDKLKLLTLLYCTI